MLAAPTLINAAISNLFVAEGISQMPGAIVLPLMGAGPAWDGLDHT